jgi:hypothetical protein
MWTFSGEQITDFGFSDQWMDKSVSVIDGMEELKYISMYLIPSFRLHHWQHDKLQTDKGT